MKRLRELIAAQCTFKASIVAHDEREEVERTDIHSRRILNFGHTIAHALEALPITKDFATAKQSVTVCWWRAKFPCALACVML
jgi:3-dehydroquinate synthetase